VVARCTELNGLLRHAPPHIPQRLLAPVRRAPERHHPWHGRINKLHMMTGQHGHDHGIHVPQVPQHMHQAINHLRHDAFVAFCCEEDDLVLEDDEV